jgi:alginate O-acetyltransferase complex protein AlgI
MGGSRKGGFRTAFNLIVVWIVTGIWHGLTPNFGIWAGALLLLILWEKFLLSKNKIVIRLFGQFHVLVLIPLTWVVFALPKFTDLVHYFQRLFGQHIEGSVINAKDYLNLLTEGWIFLFLAVFCLIPGIRDFLERKKYGVFTTILLFALFWISIYSASGASLNPFMYMNF